jgi:uncharacterized membrane protein
MVWAALHQTKYGSIADVAYIFDMSDPAAAHLLVMLVLYQLAKSSTNVLEWNMILLIFFLCLLLLLFLGFSFVRLVLSRTWRQEPPQTIESIENSRRSREAKSKSELSSLQKIHFKNVKNIHTSADEEMIKH